MDCGRYDSFIYCNVQQPSHNDIGEVVESLTIEKLDTFLENLEKTRASSIVTSNAPVLGFFSFPMTKASGSIFFICFDTRSNSGP